MENPQPVAAATLQPKFFRVVPIGQSSPDAVTVGIERSLEGGAKAAVWWESKGDVDADEAEFASVDEAFVAAEAARALHGFAEVVVVLAEPELWDNRWGALQSSVAREPIGDVTDTDLSSDETYELAAGLEAERDA